MWRIYRFKFYIWTQGSTNYNLSSLCMGSQNDNEFTAKLAALQIKSMHPFTFFTLKLQRLPICNVVRNIPQPWSRWRDNLIAKNERKHSTKWRSFLCKRITEIATIHGGNVMQYFGLTLIVGQTFSFTLIRLPEKPNKSMTYGRTVASDDRFDRFDHAWPATGCYHITFVLRIQAKENRQIFLLFKPSHPTCKCV